MMDPGEQAALLALTQAAPAAWYEVSELVEEVGSARAVLARSHLPDEPRLARVAEALASTVTDDNVSHWSDVLADLRETHPDVSLVTVLDEQYPANLRLIYNRPPFLFVRGALLGSDERSLAVVGTRSASPEGLHQARRLASELADRGVAVVSGLAAGIDTAAHVAALDAGGRTIAVMGTGIDRVYPAANRFLAQRIAEGGALVSQFWPGMAPRQQNFPLRNVVTSGIAAGTVVIEASSTSGAKMQARLALEHGKRLFLIESLVMHEDWARNYAKRRGATVVRSVDDVLKVLDADLAALDQMALF
jgi:DNA processing protein